jgi:hypothetical protein
MRNTCECDGSLCANGNEYLTNFLVVVVEANDVEFLKCDFNKDSFRRDITFAASANRAAHMKLNGSRRREDLWLGRRTRGNELREGELWRGALRRSGSSWEHVVEEAHFVTKES